MLKKTDLSKQFDLVVKQEIKNYQDSLNFVLQSINELKQEIKSVRNESLEHYAFLKCQDKDLAIQLQSTKNSLDNLNQSFFSVLSDQRAINDSNTIHLRDITSIVNDKLIDINDCDEQIKEVCVELSKFKDESQKNFRILNDNLDDLLRRFRQEIQKAKQEILDSPSEASLVKTYLEEKISSHCVDVEGIMRELRIYKHENMVTQKKIENIYMLIERLKKSEVGK